jgi:hypothetical protein
MDFEGPGPPETFLNGPVVWICPPGSGGDHSVPVHDRLALDGKGGL